MVNLDVDRHYFKKSIQILTEPAIESLIESKRITLNVIVQMTGDLTDPRVVCVSQEIDEYIVQLQKMKNRKNHKY